MNTSQWVSPSVATSPFPYSEETVEQTLLGRWVQAMGGISSGRRRRPLRARARAQATVEVAALFALMLPIVIGIVDLGRAYFAYNTLVHAVNEGARRGTFDSSSTNIVAAVQAAATSVTLESGDIAVACYGGSTSTAKACSSMVMGDTVEVSARALFTPLTPMIGALLPGGTLTVGAVTRRSFQ